MNAAAQSTPRWRSRAGLAFALGAGGAVLSVLPGVVALEESLGLGGLFALRGRLAEPPSVAIVGIDRDAAVALGQTTELDTWPRELHARLIDALAAAGVTAIAFDLVFDDPREPVGDELLAAAIARAGNVLLAERIEDGTRDLGAGAAALIETRVLPLAQLRAGALGTAPFILPRVPVRVGQSWVFGRLAADTPSLPVAALQAHVLAHYEPWLRLLDTAVPGVTARWPRTRAELVAAHGLEVTLREMRAAFTSDPNLARAARAGVTRLGVSAETEAALLMLVDLYAGPSSRYVNFYGPAGTVRTVPYDHVLARADGLGLAGKTVFVGLAESRQSAQDDDFYSVFSQPTGQNLSGVEIGATVFANLLEQRFVRPLPLPAHLLLVLAFGGVVGLVVGRARGAPAALSSAGAGGVYLALAYWQFASDSLWLPLVVPLLVQLPAGLGVALWRSYRALALQRERVHTALGYYVPQALVRRLAEQTVAHGAERQLLRGTCLYTDAERYTTVAETLSPGELADLMNAYYAELFRVVAAHGGEISDTAGDSMVAVWATALPDPTVRQRATQAAVAILAAVDAFNAAHPGRHLPTRVGLASGELLLGHIGAEQRYEYRAIGDIVNTAARIQGLNPLLGTRVLVSAATLEGVTAPPARDVGNFLLRGKRVPVTVCEPLPAMVQTFDGEALHAFGAALAQFRCGSWSEAQRLFATLAAVRPADGPTRYYAALAARYAQDPPPAWAGAVEVLAK